MALNNYANLKASIQNWSHRNDVTDIIDDFILIAETEMYSNDDSMLRVRSMEQLDTSATNTTDRFLALPTGFLEARRLDITANGTRHTIEYKTPDQMYIDINATGVPRYFTVTDQIEFDIQPDQAYVTNLNYFGKLPALSDVNTTNAILTNNPNIYLYGALRALFQWAANSEEESLNYARFVKAIEGANKADKKGRYGPAPVQRLRGATP